MIYLFVLILLLFLICRYDIAGDEKNRDFWYRCVLFIFIAIAGFRYRIGGDTINYLEIYYHDTHPLSELTFDDLFSSGLEPLYVLLTSAVKSLGGKFFCVQILQAFVVNGLIFSYFRKHSECVFTCIFIYALWAYSLFNFEEMRASISLALCLYANDFFLEKKWLKGFSLYIIGCLFHYSTILLLLTPFLLFLKFNLVGVVFLCLAIPVGALAELILGDYLVILDMGDQISGRAIGYLNNDDLHVKHSIFYYLIDMGLCLFYIIFSYWFIHHKNIKNDILKFQPFLIIGMIFFLAKSNFEILTRYAHFYYPYFIIPIAMMFVDLVRRNIQTMKSLAWGRAVVFFFPFFFYLISYYFSSPPRMLSNSYHNYQKYLPYASVFERSISKEREKLFNNLYSVQIYHLEVKEDEY